MNHDRPGQDGRPRPAARMPHPATLPLLLALVPWGISCAPGDAAPRDRVEIPVADDGRALAPPAGRPSAVEAICWGGPPADRRLGALFDDGRFAVYRPTVGPAPVAVGLVAPGRGILAALAVTQADRAVTGDGLGLVLWDTSEALARPIDRVDCGAVGALAVEPIGPGDLIAGLEDGRLLRFRPGRDAIGPPRSEARSTGRSAGVRGLGFADGGRSLLVVRLDGRAERRPRSLEGPGDAIGPAVVAAEARGRLVRVLGPLDDGPALEASRPDGVPLWRFPLPADGTGVAAVLGGDGLVVACDGRVLLIRPPPDGPPRPSEVRGLPADGPTRLAADPVDPAGRRVALADSAGRLLVFDAEELARSAAPIPLDNAADLAFRPQRRAYHPRPLGGREPATSERLASRIAEARRLLDRGELDGLLAVVRDLEADPALDRDASAEVHALTAAVRQATGWAAAGIRHPIASARSTFALRGRLDREADLRLWAGSVLVPSFDGRAEAADLVRIEEALAEFRRAAALFRRADPALERQARIAEAMTAWGLLALGRPRDAQAAFVPVARWAAGDPVLRQAPEFDRIAAAMAASRGDWEAADHASDRLLRRLSPASPDRLALAREATLERVGDLAALGRWSEAARILEVDRPGDPEWTIRRATARRRAGIDLGPVDPSPPDGPLDAPEAVASAHVRGRVLVAGDATRAPGVELLARAAEAHRRLGRSDLAIEADLERAEALERLDRPAEAIELYARAARTLAPEGERSRTRGAARPIAFAAARAHRGLARCQLALDRPEHALGALDQAALVSWFGRSGEARVRASSLVAPAGGSTADSLREARRSIGPQGGLAGLDADSSAMARQREARHAASHRELTLAAPTRPIDPAMLRLGEGEAALVVAAVGPESLAGFLIRPGRPVIARALAAGRSDLRRAARIWRAALGDGGRAVELEPSPGPVGLLSIAPEPDLSRRIAGRADPPPERPRPPGSRSIGIAGDFGAPGPASSPGRFLVGAVLGPFLGELAGVDRLTVVPDDALAAVPLEALAIGADAPVLATIRYAPSVSVLRRSRESARSDAGAAEPGRPVLVVSAGDPVAALAVRAAYGHGPGGRAVEATADPASLPARLIGGEESPGVIHLEAVAVLDPAASTAGMPELVLGPTTSAEIDPAAPRLSGSDVLGLELDGALIILAIEHRPAPPAAEPTAWRDLAACWLAAGAGAVVVGIWDPPADSAPAFAAALHRGLARGLGPSEALDGARRALASRPETADPVHWAGFVLYEAAGERR